MDKPKKRVMIGILGSQLDAGRGAKRWEKWRPTVAMHQQTDVIIDRTEILHAASHQPIAALVREDIISCSPQTDVRLHEMQVRDPWDLGQVYAALFDFAQRYPFDTEHEEYWIHITTGTHVAQICLFLLTEARYLPGVLLQTSPPRRQDGSSPGHYGLIDLDLSRYDQVAVRRQSELQEQRSQLKAGIPTRNTAFNRMVDELSLIAVRSSAPVLLMGPTGAGKSFLAQRLYELKKQRHQLSGAFVEVNCATLHGDGAASALFGHVRGAYTGAAQDRAGLLRSAHRGLLFLDEIGELGLDEQAMLLKAIEEKRFYPVGSDTEVQSDFQLIAGTNRNLAQDVRAGRFREDLLARIKLWTYTLPGLYERREDLAPNLDYLLEQFSAQQGQRIHMNKEARDIYLRFAASPAALWSGNFRDLSASVTRMATLANQGRIDTPLVQHEIQRLQRDWQALGAEPAALQTDSVLSKLFSEQQLADMDLFDQTQLETVVSVCLKSASLSEAGRTLFAASRARKAQSNDADRVRKYLMKFGLQFEQIRAAVQ